MTKIRNKNCDKNQNLKLWKDPKSQTVTKLENSKYKRKKERKKCEKLLTKKIKLLQNSKTQIVTTPKLKLWHNSKSQSMTKVKNSNCDKLWQKSKNQIVTKLDSSNSEKI